MRTSLALALVTLAGCAGLPHEAGCTQLAPSLRYCLQALPPGTALTVHQLVEFTLAARPDGERLVFALDAAGTHMQIVALTPLGQRVFRVTTDDGALGWEGPAAAEGLGQRLPALIQLMLWPEGAARKGLEPGAELTVSAQGRTLRLGDAPPVLTTRQSDSDPARGTIDALFAPMDARIRITRLDE